MSGHGATVVFGALNGAAPALGFSIAGRQSRNGLVVDKNGLGIVACGVVEFVCELSLAFPTNVLSRILHCTYNASSPYLQRWR